MTESESMEMLLIRQLQKRVADLENTREKQEEYRKKHLKALTELKVKWDQEKQ